MQTSDRFFLADSREKVSELVIRKEFFVPVGECRATNLIVDKFYNRDFKLIRQHQTIVDSLINHTVEIDNSDEIMYCNEGCIHKTFMTRVTQTMNQWKHCSHAPKQRVNRRTSVYVYDGELTNSNANQLCVTITQQLDRYPEESKCNLCTTSTQLSKRERKEKEREKEAAIKSEVSVHDKWKKLVRENRSQIPPPQKTGRQDIHEKGLVSCNQTQNSSQHQHTDGQASTSSNKVEGERKQKSVSNDINAQARPQRFRSPTTGVWRVPNRITMKKKRKKGSSSKRIPSQSCKRKVDRIPLLSQQLPPSGLFKINDPRRRVICQSTPAMYIDPAIVEVNETFPPPTFSEFKRMEDSLN